MTHTSIRLLLSSLLAVALLATPSSATAVPGGASRPNLSFAGTLRKDGAPLTGAQTVTFSFKKGGGTLCSPKLDNVLPDAAGFFQVDIPLASCPSTLFDGGDVVFDVQVGNSTIATNQRVNPVPYAKYADQVGVSECPLGWAPDASVTSFVLCRKGLDEMVRVGTGGSTFWIDRYEATVNAKSDGSGTNYGAGGDDYPSTFPDNGQWTQPLYAVSKSGNAPSGYLTWFQAAEACRLAGKRLPTRAEWLAAARGTQDPATPHDGTNGFCRTNGTTSRQAGGGNNCVSAAGAQDLIGNLAEWTDEWLAAAGTGSNVTQPWPQAAGFGDDGVTNVTSSAVAGSLSSGTPVQGLPSAVLRGGAAGDGTRAGIFAMSLAGGPSASGPLTGFRCVTAR
ncbi:MAG: formylglycine-generating enzyme family protein [Myxococcales bacterium]